MEENLHIDDHLRKMLSRLEVQPQVHSFGQVMKALEKKKRRRLFIWFWTGLVLISGLSSLSYWYATQIAENKIIVADRVQKNSEHPAAKKTVRKSVKPKGSVIPDLNSKPVNHSHSGTNQINKPVLGAVASKQLSETNATNSFFQKESRVMTPVLLHDEVKDSSIDAAEVVQTKILRQESAENELVYSDTLVSNYPSFLPIGTVDPEILPEKNQAKNMSLKRRPTFFLALSVEPRMMTNLVTVNRTIQVPTTVGTAYPVQKNNDKVQVKFSYGLKAGLVFKSRYEVMAGIGKNRFSGPGRYSPQAYVNTVNSQTIVSPASDVNFDYTWFSADFSRYCNVGRYLRIKAGAGAQAGMLTQEVKGPSLYSVNVVTDKNFSSSYLYFANFKIGFIEDLGRRIQLQACPTAFFALNSVYESSYLVNQRPYGLGLECLLIYKFK